MDLGLRVGLDCIKALQAKYIGERLGADDTGRFKLSGRLSAQCIAVHDKTDASEAFSGKEAVEQSDCKLCLSGAGGHRKQHGAAALGQVRLHLLDSAFLVR